MNDAWSLEFNETLDVGGLAELVLSGAGQASVEAAVRLGLAAGFNLLPMAAEHSSRVSTRRKGIRTNANGGPDLNFVTASGEVVGVRSGCS